MAQLMAQPNTSFIIPCTARVEEREIFAVCAVHVHYFTICQIIITSNNQPDYSGVSHAVVMPHATPLLKGKSLTPTSSVKWPKQGVSCGRTALCPCQSPISPRWSYQTISNNTVIHGTMFLASGTLHAGRVSFFYFFPTCQVRVVRFYVSCLLLLSSPLLLISSPPPPRRPPRPPRPTATRDPQCSLSDLNHDHPCSVFPAGPQPRVSMLSVPCRTSTTTIPAQSSLPDLNHDHPRPVFPAGPQPRVSPPSVPCRTSTTTIHAQCSLPDLNREYPRQKICHIECQKICQIEC